MPADATTTSAPAALVTTDWARQHLDDPTVRFLEVDVDTDSYDTGHLPGATGVNWKTQLTDSVRRDLVSGDELEALVRFLDATGTRPLVDRTVPMEQARDGFAAMAGGDVFGKIVFTR